jgi:hypothetical protein
MYSKPVAPPTMLGPLTTYIYTYKHTHTYTYSMPVEPPTMFFPRTTYTHTHTHTHIYIYIYIDTHTHIYIRILTVSLWRLPQCSFLRLESKRCEKPVVRSSPVCICMYVCMHACMYVCMCHSTGIQQSVRSMLYPPVLCMHIYIHIYTHT